MARPTGAQQREPEVDALPHVDGCFHVPRVMTELFLRVSLCIGERTGVRAICL